MGKLNKFAPNTIVTPQELHKAGFIKFLKRPLKVLGDGEIDRPLIVKANKFSAIAAKKIMTAGGKVEEI